MKKDSIRDYATAAFQYYAYLGKPSKEDLAQKYYDEAKEEFTHEFSEVKGTGIFKPTEAQIVYAESKVREKQGELWDILAVEKTLAQLNKWERQAVEMVYFEDAEKDLEKGDIEQRVAYATINIPAGRRTIFRWLAKARKVFAFERGLRNNF